jgi:hypothetical protein
MMNVLQIDPLELMRLLRKCNKENVGDIPRADVREEDGDGQLMREEDDARHEALRSAEEEKKSLTAMAGGGPLARVRKRLVYPKEKEVEGTTKINGRIAGGGGKRPATATTGASAKSITCKTQVESSDEDEEQSEKVSRAKIVAGKKKGVSSEEDEESEEEVEEEEPESMEEEEEDDTSDDDWGSIEKIKKFCWCPKNPDDSEFLVNWSKKGTIKNPAILILTDLPEEGLKEVWKMRRSKAVVHWIDGLDVIRENIKGWKGFEIYAAEKCWVGAMKLPPTSTTEAKSLPKKKQCVASEKVGGGGGGIGMMLEEKEEMPTPISAGRVMELEIKLAQSSDSTLTSTTDFDGDGTDGMEPVDPNEDDGPKLMTGPLCKYRDHNWENCDRPEYAKKGRLTGRKCQECKGRFMDRKIEKGENEAGKCFVTGRHAAQYCTRCKVCYCHKCFENYVVQSVKEPRTPRKGEH